MPVSQPLVITSPDLAPQGREWWFMDPTVGPVMSTGTVAMVFYGCTRHTLNYKLRQIKDEYDLPIEQLMKKNAGRRFTLYDIERITRIFLNRGIIDYRKYYAATQIFKAMGALYNLI